MKRECIRVCIPVRRHMKRVGQHREWRAFSSMHKDTKRKRESIQGRGSLSTAT